MPEMADACKHHRQVAFVRCSDDFRIAHTATRLDGRSRAGPGGTD
jgi:hypothetical protein